MDAVVVLWTSMVVLGASPDGTLATQGLLRPEAVLSVWVVAHLPLVLGRHHLPASDEYEDGCGEEHSPRLYERWSAGERREETAPAPRRSRRSAHEHAQALDPHFLHVPLATLEHLPDGESACDAMRNASVLRQVLPPQVDVEVQPPCPVRMRLHQDAQRVWPSRLLVAECACPAASCRPRTAYVCTQIVSPVLVVMADGDGRLRQHRVMLPVGCQCMSARATLVEYPYEGYT